MVYLKLSASGHHMHNSFSHFPEEVRNIEEKKAKAKSNLPILWINILSLPCQRLSSTFTEFKFIGLGVAV